MPQKKQTPTTVDDYIAEFPEEIRLTLEKIRAMIAAICPEATQKMVYGVPTFYLNGNMIHYAAFKSHYGVYPGDELIKVFAEKLSAYETSRGTVKFPFKKPVPFDLIAEIAEAAADMARKRAK